MILLILLPIAAFAAAEEELTVAPDRPGFADGTTTVPVGHLQMEFGVRADFEDNLANLTLPSLLLRAGLTSFLEARITAPDLVIGVPRDGSATTAAGDTSLGLKLAIAFGDLFSASAVPFISFPTGSSGASSDGVDGGVGLNFQLSPTDALAIGWNTNFGVVTDGDQGRLFDFAAGVSVGYQFTDAFGAFVESYFQYTDGFEKLFSVAGGLTYLVTPKIQLDLSGGAGLNREEKEAPYVVAGFAALL